MNDAKRFLRRIDSAIDNYEGKVPYKSMEEILQHRAQDMHELAASNDELESIGADELDGWQDAEGAADE